MTVKCPCGTTCRIPSLPKGRVRCPKCQHIFTPQELVRAQPEARPQHPDIFADEYELENEEDGPVD